MAMRRGCQAAGLVLYSPHDLRHRYASGKVREDVPVTDLAAQLGHARKSMALDTYSHVLQTPLSSPARSYWGTACGRRRITTTATAPSSSIPPSAAKGPTTIHGNVEPLPPVGAF
jgi:hypothetical protein